MTAPHTALVLIEAFEAGTAGPIDAEKLAGIFRDARRNGGGLDAAFGLAPGWAEQQQMRDRDDAIEAALPTAKSAREAAKRLQLLLTRYAAAAFIADRSAGRARRPEHVEFYRILTANQGRIPGLTMLREKYSQR